MGSPFASHTTSDPIPLPFDPPHWVQVRKLTGREHERAQEAHRDGLAIGRGNVWSAFLRRALEKGATDPEALKAIRDPLTGYDRYELVKAGLVAWSYDRPVDVAATDDLVDDAVEFIARLVLKFTKPALFAATEEDAAAAQRELQAAAPVA